MDQELFPIPNSGQITIVLRGLGAFDVELSGLDTVDYHQLMSFFNHMHGRFEGFRFEHAGVAYPRCRFDSDRADFISHGPDRHFVTFPIKVLPNQG